MQYPISTFKGLDTRRSVLTSVPGTMETLQDAVINQGAQVEKRLAFVATDAVFTNTFGGIGTPAGIMVFGSVASGTLSLPAGFLYQQLIHPDGTTQMNGVLSNALFGNFAFVVAQFTDNQVFCYYNGVIVTDFISGVVLANITTNALLAQSLTSLVNNTGSYTALQDAGSAANEFDVYSLPGNSYSNTLNIATTANISISTSSDVSYTSANIFNTNGLNAVDGSKIVVGNHTYQFKTTMGAAYDVQIASTYVQTLTNLYLAINAAGVAGTNYYTGTTANTQVYAQNLIASNNPTFQVVSYVSNVQGDVENSIAGLDYLVDSATVSKAIAIQSTGQFTIEAFAPSTYAVGTITKDGSTTQPSSGSGNKITIGGQDYSFQTSPTTNYQVQIQTPSGADPTPAYILTMMGLMNLINGVYIFETSGSWGNAFYRSGYVANTTPPNPKVIATGVFGATTTSYITLTAIVLGSTGNTTLTTSGTTHMTVSSGITGGTGGVLGAISQITVGPLFAYGSITTNGVNPTAAQTVTINGGTPYKFVASVVSTGDVLIGANAQQTMQNLIMAINNTGVQNLNYITNGPDTNVRALPSLNGNVLTLISLLAGTAGNAYTLATTSSTLTLSAATLTLGADIINLLAAPIYSILNETTSTFANQVIVGINANTTTSGFYATLIGNTVYIYSQAGNTFSNNATVSVYVPNTNQTAIGFCAVEFNISQPVATAVNGSGAVADAIVKTITIDGLNVLSGTHGFNHSAGVTDNATTITVLINNIALDINTNSSIYAAVPVGNVLYLSKLVTTSLDSYLSVQVGFTGANSNNPQLTASIVGRDNLVAVASPTNVNFLRVAAGASFTRDTLLSPQSTGTLLLNAISPISLLSALGKVFNLGFGSGTKMRTLSFSPIIVTCKATGGYPPYTYQWVWVSGDNGFSVTNVNNPSVTFSRPDNAGSNTAYWACDVIDSLGNVATSNQVRIYQP